MEENKNIQQNEPINDSDTLNLPDIYKENTKILIDSNITNHALGEIKKLCKGNISKKIKLELIKEEGETYLIDYRIKISLSTDIGTKHETGISQEGKVIKDISEIEQCKENIINNITNNPALKSEIIENLGDKSESIIHSITQKLITIKDCDLCLGAKKSRCPTCHGNGQATCSHCRGNKVSQCHFCNGTGNIFQNNQKLVCHSCHGNGRINCNFCHASGVTKCSTCGGGGSIKCDHCSGTGQFSTIYTITTKATKFVNFDSNHLPAHLSRYVTDHSESLLSLESIRTKEYPLNREEEDNNNEISTRYFIKLPSTDITIRIKDIEIKGTVIGYNAELHNFNNFLEKICSKEIKALNIAAENKKRTNNILGRIRTSLILNIISQSASHSNKQAYKNLIKKYYIGINKGNLKKLIIKSERSLRNITQIPRLIGLGLGLLITSILYGLYYIGDGRNILVAEIDNKNIMNLLDFVIVLLGGSLTTISIQLNAKRTLHKILGQFISKDKLSSISPKTGKSATFGYLSGTIIYFIMMEIAISEKIILPEWYYYLRTIIEIYT